MGVTDLALTCGSERVIDAVCTAVVGSARIGRALDAGSDREGQIFRVYATLATRDSHSLRKMMTTSCTLIISAEQHERLLALDIVSHRSNFFSNINCNYWRTARNSSCFTALPDHMQSWILSQSLSPIHTSQFCVTVLGATSSNV